MTFRRLCLCFCVAALGVGSLRAQQTLTPEQQKEAADALRRALEQAPGAAPAAAPTAPAPSAPAPKAPPPAELKLPPPAEPGPVVAPAVAPAENVTLPPADP